jgi:signal transduction histidine kinase
MATAGLMNIPLGVATWVGVFVPVAAGVTAWLVRRQVGKGQELSLRGMLALVVWGMAVFWGICIVPAGFWGWVGGFPMDYREFFIREASNVPLNMVLVAPVVAEVIQQGSARRWRGHWVEGALAAAALLVTSWLAFRINDGRGNLDCMIYLPLPALLWLAIRFEPGATSAGMLLVGCVAFFTAAHRAGPFAHLEAGPRVLAVQLVILALGVPVVFLSSVIAERRSAQEAVRRHLKQVESLAAELTRSEERQRRELAALLHDGVGQRLFAATAQLLALQGEGGSKEINQVIGILEDATRDARNLTFELCPPVLYELGLAPALQRLTDQFAATHRIRCTLQGALTGPGDLNLRGLAYQAVRELLNNVAKHADAQNVSVSLAQRAGEIEISVADDGQGVRADASSPGQDGFGLFRLRERIEVIGGAFAVESRERQGFLARFSLPTDAPGAQENGS